MTAVARIEADAGAQSGSGTTVLTSEEKSDASVLTVRKDAGCSRYQLPLFINLPVSGVTRSESQRSRRLTRGSGAAAMNEMANACEMINAG
jgi:hypothetical protein